MMPTIRLTTALASCITAGIASFAAARYFGTALPFETGVVVGTAAGMACMLLRRG